MNNYVRLIGRVSKKPVLYNGVDYLGNQTINMKLGLLVSSPKKLGKQDFFFFVRMIEKNVKELVSQLEAGQTVCVCGVLRSTDIKNPDGTTRYYCEVLADSIFLTGPAAIEDCNNVTLYGKVSQKPELTYWHTNNGQKMPILKLGLLVKPPKSVDNKELFYFVKLLGEDALLVQQTIDIGSEIQIDGLLRGQSKDGQYLCDIIANNISIAITKKNENIFGLSKNVVSSTPITPVVVGGTMAKNSGKQSGFGQMVIPDNIDELIG